MEKWLLSMDSRGAALTHAMLRDMANLLLRSRELTPSDPPQKVGKNWTTEFVKRHRSLSSCLSRKYKHERALSEDPEIIFSWFKLVENTIKKYGITSDDIYNFDESGFAMGISSTQRIITSAEYSGIRNQIPLEDTLVFFPSDPLECQPRIALFHVALTANHSN